MRYGKKEVVATLRQTITTCDLCGGNVYVKNGRDHSEVTIEARIGHYYDSDFRVVTGIDCCVPCWRDKVLPALLQLGAKPRTWDSDDGEPMEEETP